jgi:hypothetical protein
MKVAHLPKKYFTEQDLIDVISLWDGRYSVKKHQGYIETITFTKEYHLAKDEHQKISTEIMRLRDFVTIEGDSNRLVISLNVKASEIHEFKNFCRMLKEIEGKVNKNG